MLIRSVQLIRARLLQPDGRRLVLALVAAAIARAGQLALAIVLARRVGAGDYGLFTFAVGAATTGAYVAALGWPDLFNRLFPEFVKGKDWGRLRGLTRLSDLMVLCSAALVVIVLLGLSVTSSELQPGFLYAAALTLPFGWIMLRRQQLASVKHAALGLLFDQGFAAFITIGIVMVFGLHVLGTTVAVFVGASMLSVMLTTIILRIELAKTAKTAEPAKPKYETRAWVKAMLPMSVGNLAKQLLSRVDILLLAPLASVHDVGLYGAAWRLTYLLSFPQGVLMTILTPLLSESYAHGDHRRTQRIMRQATIYAWATTVPTMIVFLAAPSFIMTAVFGAEFEGAGRTLALLGLAQFAAAFINARSSLLMMAGQEGKFALINGFALSINVALNLVLIPVWGRDGAATAVLVSACLSLALHQHYTHKLQRSFAKS